MESGVGAGTHLRPHFKPGSVLPVHRGNMLPGNRASPSGGGGVEARGGSAGSQSPRAGQTAGRPRVSPKAAAFETTGPQGGVSALTTPRISQWDGAQCPGHQAWLVLRREWRKQTLRCRWRRGGGRPHRGSRNHSAGVPRANSVSSVTPDLAATREEETWVLPQDL